MSQTVGPANAATQAALAGQDDPANTSGLSAPAIIRGTVYAHLASGVTLGSGQSQAVQTATLTGLQAALNYAVNNRKFFEIEPNVYEIYGAAGLTCPTSNTAYLNWHGSKSSTINQFYANAPILTFGDTGGSNTLFNGLVDGFSVNYGVSQAGNTNANAIMLGQMAFCVIQNFNTSSDTQGATTPNNSPYNGMMITAGSGTFYNNAIRDCDIGAGQNTLLTLGAQGTGNQFSNVYLHNGSNNNGSPTGHGVVGLAALFIGNASYSTISDNYFERLNIEAVTGGNIIYLRESFNTAFIDMHIEGIGLNSYGSHVIYCDGSHIKLIEACIEDVVIVSGGSVCSYIGDTGSGGQINVDGLNIMWNYNSNNLAGQTTPIFAVNGNNDWNTVYRMTNLQVRDYNGTTAGNLTLDSNTPSATFGGSPYGSSLGEYVGDNVLPYTTKYQPMILGNYTHYGMHRNSVLIVPASLAAATTITLSNRQRPSGLGSTVATNTNEIVRIRRQSGTYASALTIADAASGATVFTNTTSGADYFLVFNGSNWADASVTNTTTAQRSIVAYAAAPAFSGAINNATFDMTLTGNVAPTLSGFIENYSYAVVFRQPASGGPYTATWPAAWVWPGGTKLVLSTAASAVDGVFLQVIAGIVWATPAKGMA